MQKILPGYVFCLCYLLVHLVILHCRADLRRGYSLLQRGHRLEKRLITNLGGISFLDCVEECLRTTRCLSVNYFQPAHFCEVNFKKKDSVPPLYLAKPGWFYSERNDWDKEMVSSCSQSNCRENEKCTPRPIGEFTCKLSDCGVPVNEEYSLENVQDGDGIGITKRMNVTCLEGFEKQGSGLFICRTDGVWKRDLKCILSDCFKDNNTRVLEKDIHNLNPNGKEYCKRHCSKLGFYKYFGVENGNECFCGNTTQYMPEKATGCDKPCTGNKDELCGGEWRIMLFTF